MKVLSIIIPVYNVEEYLEECIDSIISQYNGQFEIVLVNDGSTDNSGKICDIYSRQHDFIKVIHKENGGLSSARNVGIENSKSKWISFVDSDDTVSDNYINVLFNVINDDDVDVVRFEYTSYNSRRRIIGTNRINVKGGIANKITSTYNLVNVAVNGEWFAWLYLLRRESLRGMKFDELMKFQEDIEFFQRFLSNEELRCKYLPERIYNYRIRPYSLTTEPKIDNFQYSFMIGSKFHELSKVIKNEKFSELYYLYGNLMYYWTILSMCDSEFYDKKNEIFRLNKVEDYYKLNKKRLRFTKRLMRYYLMLWLQPKISMRILNTRNKLRNFVLATRNKNK